MIRIYMLCLLSAACLFSQQVSAQIWNFQQKFGPEDQEAQDNFGFSTAISDSFMVIGAWWEDGELEGNAPVNESGAAYVLKLQPNGTWLEVQKLISPNRERLGYFGHSVAISDSFMLVGAINEDRGQIGNPGAGYVYRRSSADQWTLEGRLIADDAQNGDVLGWSVAITDGYALLGAPNHKLDENGGNSLDKAGAAYLFERQGNQTWQLIKKLVAFDRIEDANFGKYVDIDKKGLIIGAFNADHGFSPLRAGQAYAAYNDTMMFSTLSSSDLQMLRASDAGNLDFFGWDVAISEKWAVVGASGKNTPPPGSQDKGNGAAYFFHYENGMWVEKQKVYASDHVNSGQFGRAIDIEGEACIIGAGTASSDENNSNLVFGSGAAHIFELQAGNTWSEVQKLAGTGRNPNDLYGEAVALYGNQALVGAWLADSIGNSELIDGGAIYTYERNWPLSRNDLPEITGLQLVQRIDNPETLKIINQGTLGQTYKIQVYSSQGQKLFEEETQLFGEWNKEFPALTSGLYIVRIARDAHQSLSWKWLRR